MGTATKDAFLTDKTKTHIAKMAGVSSYEEIVSIQDGTRASVIKSAQKTRKIKVENPSGEVYPMGSPYVMLGRKVRSNGRRVYGQRKRKRN